MLLRDVPPSNPRLRVVDRKKKDSSKSNRRRVPLKQESVAKIRLPQAENQSSVVLNSPAVELPKSEAPLWLKSLILLNHGSTLFCYVSATVALIMYGMTVYAPKLWTQKYVELQDLQKKERQFTSADETLRDELAQSANEGNSGFVNPTESNQPIFLPNKPTKAIELKSSTVAEPKIINPISPIAY